MECPLCGLRFAPTADCASRGCPLQHACNFVCCPRCGYQIVDPARADSIRLLKRLWKRDDRTKAS